MFDEIDYVLEARNAERFASLYGDWPGKCFIIAYDILTNLKVNNYMGLIQLVWPLEE